MLALDEESGLHQIQEDESSGEEDGVRRDCSSSKRNLKPSVETTDDDKHLCRCPSFVLLFVSLFSDPITVVCLHRPPVPFLVSMFHVICSFQKFSVLLLHFSIAHITIANWRSGLRGLITHMHIQKKCF